MHMDVSWDTYGCMSNVTVALEWERDSCHSEKSDILYRENRHTFWRQYGMLATVHICGGQEGDAAVPLHALCKCVEKG